MARRLLGREVGVAGDALLHDRHDRDDEQQDRQAEEEVGHPGDDAVGPAADVAGQQAQRDTEQRRDRGRDEADDERRSRTDRPAGEEVATEARLDTEPVGGAGTDGGQSVEVDELGVHGVGVGFRPGDRVHALQRVEERREDRDEDEEQDDDRADDGDLVDLEAVPGDATR